MRGALSAPVERRPSRAFGVPGERRLTLNCSGNVELLVQHFDLLIANQNLNRSVNFGKKLCTKPRSLTLISVSCFAQISLGPRPNHEAPFHTSTTVSGAI